MSIENTIFPGQTWSVGGVWCRVFRTIPPGKTDWMWGIATPDGIVKVDEQELHTKKRLAEILNNVGKLVGSNFQAR